MFRGRGGHGGPGMRPPPHMDMHGGMPMDPMGMPMMMMGGPMGGFGPMGMRPPMDMMGGFGGFGGYEGDFGGMQVAAAFQPCLCSGCWDPPAIPSEEAKALALEYNSLIEPGR